LNEVHLPAVAEVDTDYRYFTVVETESGCLDIQICLFAGRQLKNLTLDALTTIIIQQHAYLRVMTGSLAQLGELT
jgi:hypothetical protein